MLFFAIIAVTSCLCIDSLLSMLLHTAACSIFVYALCVWSALQAPDYKLFLYAATAYLIYHSLYASSLTLPLMLITLTGAGAYLLRQRIFTDFISCLIITGVALGIHQALTHNLTPLIGPYLITALTYAGLMVQALHGRIRRPMV